MQPASSPAHFLVTLSGFSFATPGSFRTKSGGNRTAEARRYRSGGSPSEEVAGGPSTTEDITIGREWRRDRDLALAKAASRLVGRARGTITVQPLDDEFNRYGEPYVYSDALLTGVNFPDVDAEGGADVSSLEMVFAVSGEIA